MTDTHHVIPHANRPIFQWQEWYTFQWQPTAGMRLIYPNKLDSNFS